MKRIIFFVVLLGLISWAAWSVMNPDTISQDTEEVQMNTYTDPEGVFTFNYSDALNVSGREATSTVPFSWSPSSSRPGRVLATADISRSYQPNTNFSEAKLTIGWSNDAQAIRTCTAVTNDPMPNGPIISDVTVSGYPFKKMISGDAGAGNFYETTSYIGLLDGDCYVISYVIHSTNIGNYSPEQGITEFDKARVVRELDGIVNSFRFLVNSD